MLTWLHSADARSGQVNEMAGGQPGPTAANASPIALLTLQLVGPNTEGSIWQHIYPLTNCLC